MTAKPKFNCPKGFTDSPTDFWIKPGDSWLDDSSSTVDQKCKHCGRPSSHNDAEPDQHWRECGFVQIIQIRAKQ